MRAPSCHDAHGAGGVNHPSVEREVHDQRHVIAELSEDAVDRHEADRPDVYLHLGERDAARKRGEEVRRRIAGSATGVGDRLNWAGDTPDG